MIIDIIKYFLKLFSFLKNLYYICTMKYFKVTEQFNESRTDEDLEFEEFYKENNTVLGWLLYIDDSLFNRIHSFLEEEFVDEGCATILANILLIMLKVNYTEKFSKEDYEYMYKKLIVDVNLINMVKEGLLTYKVADKDDNWEFKRTEKGKKLYESYTN